MDGIESVDYFGSMDIFAIPIFPIHWHRIPFLYVRFLSFSPLVSYRFQNIGLSPNCLTELAAVLLILMQL